MLQGLRAGRRLALDWRGFHVFRLLLVGVLLTMAVAEAPEARRDASLETVTRWVALVEAHQPGEADESALKMAAFTPDERLRLIEAAGPFVGYLRKLSMAGAQAPGARPAPDSRYGSLGETTLRGGALAPWLRRAIILETDAAILAPEVTARAMSNARDARLPEALHADDGSAGARMLLNWHWEFARTLAGFRGDPLDDTFERNWYHVTALYMLDEALLGELGPHLKAGVVAVGSDARMLFDLACLSDAYGSAKVQSVLATVPRGFRPNVPTLEAAEANAARQFAQVLALDPGFVEARVRLARLVEKRGDAAEALDLLDTAFTASMEPPLAYMAHLTAARANQRLARLDEARRHAETANRMFPRAQAPYVALSVIALAAGNNDGAVAAVAALRTLEDRDDPWWIYYQATWLHWETALDRLRDQVRR